MNAPPDGTPGLAPQLLFELELTEGPSRRAHERALGLEEGAYPWQSLDPSRYPKELVERARRTWTETALSEYGVLAAMGQMLVAFAQARVPLDLSSQVARFAAEEVRHVELCARVAMQLGGGAPFAFSPGDLVADFDPALTPLERANELVVAVLCVGETLSLPLLTMTMQCASHPLTRAVLMRIVRDEAAHGQLGWDYLDWAELSRAERERLGRVARAAIDRHAPAWERLRSRAEHGLTSEGFLLEHIHELGWAESSAYAARARRTVGEGIIPRLAEYGIQA